MREGRGSWASRHNYLSSYLFVFISSSEPEKHLRGAGEEEERLMQVHRVGSVTGAWLPT